MNLNLVLACVALLLLPAASAGSLTDPEITDPKDDGGTPQLDILSVWLDANDPGALNLHATFAMSPPKFPSAQGSTAGTDSCSLPGGCAYTSLTYVFAFRVITPDNVFAPNFPDYAFTTVAFRDGPTAANLASPIGYSDANGVMTFDNPTATATLDATNATLTLRIPRSSAFVHVPNGAAPGAYRIDRLTAYSLPEFCFPQQSAPSVGTVSCAPLAKPVAPTVNTPPSASAHWDNAPDAGFGRVFTFPTTTGTESTSTPTPTLTVTRTSTQTVTQTVTHSQPGPSTQTTTTVTVTPAGETLTITSTQTVSGGPASKKSPAPEILLALAGVAVLLAVRRRLSA